MANLSHRYAALGILAATSLLFGLRLGDREVVSEELRFAEVAREMRATGDYFHPTINGKSYYDKPLGSYWLIVAASQIETASSRQFSQSRAATRRPRAPAPATRAA